MAGARPPRRGAEAPAAGDRGCQGASHLPRERGAAGSAGSGWGYPAGILACSRRTSGSGSRGPRVAPALGLRLALRLALPRRPGAGSHGSVESECGTEAEAGSGSAVAAPAESGDFLRGAGGGGAATLGRAPAAGAGLAPR